ncbi:putative toxin-antitoxin system, toxin component [Leptospira wolbachii serovar Codice str. CDC]|uniref:Toxin-antitoxin system, toxin component n=1 Tax=Leptospira wolbachii serovar Codice str. CDC TaxID=1218599 RepID=R8ZYL5_9LEPT|nr:toxin-antitoxin system toxin component [Leptospira wolbachii]EOQ94819.1 putative toxin-antitoxin system, toxin component [Leptospira wolbachii serovar Codice str. CDC]
MKNYRWDIEKDEILRKERGISFELVLFQIENGFLLDIIKHPNKDKYPNQSIFIIEIESYAYLIPFIENKDEIFLKTIIPSRKATRNYLLKEGYDNEI